MTRLAPITTCNQCPHFGYARVFMGPGIPTCSATTPEQAQQSPDLLPELLPNSKIYRNRAILPHKSALHRGQQIYTPTLEIPNWCPLPDKQQVEATIVDLIYDLDEYHGNCPTGQSQQTNRILDNGHTLVAQLTNMEPSK